MADITSKPLSKNEIAALLNHLQKWKDDNKSAGGNLKIQKGQGLRFLQMAALYIGLHTDRPEYVRNTLKELNEDERQRQVVGS